MPSLKDFMNAESINSPAESPSPVRGMGGGMADMVPAMIDGQQPAALSEGEFVIPADVVSMLGDGSSEAGARILQRLVDTVRKLKSASGAKQAPPLMSLLKPAKKKKKKK
jgi:hypothetical protein